MKSVLYGLAALPLLAGVALAEQPMPLTSQQMDQVTAGWSLVETDKSNTSITLVKVYQPNNNIECGSCYLLINNFALSVASSIGKY